MTLRYINLLFTLTLTELIENGCVLVSIGLVRREFP